jgi:hypothetical protein
LEASELKDLSNLVLLTLGFASTAEWKAQVQYSHLPKILDSSLSPYSWIFKYTAVGVKWEAGNLTAKEICLFYINSGALVVGRCVFHSASLMHFFISNWKCCYQHPVTAKAKIKYQLKLNGNEQRKNQKQSNKKKKILLFPMLSTSIYLNSSLVQGCIFNMK